MRPVGRCCCRLALGSRHAAVGGLFGRCHHARLLAGWPCALQAACVLRQLPAAQAQLSIAAMSRSWCAMCDAHAHACRCMRRLYWHVQASTGTWHHMCTPWLLENPVTQPPVHALHAQPPGHFGFGPHGGFAGWHDTQPELWPCEDLITGHSVRAERALRPKTGSCGLHSL